jgi:hypothetical protein
MLKKKVASDQAIDGKQTIQGQDYRYPRSFQFDPPIFGNLIESRR